MNKQSKAKGETFSSFPVHMEKTCETNTKKNKNVIAYKAYTVIDPLAALNLCHNLAKRLHSFPIFIKKEAL